MTALDEYSEARRIFASKLTKCPNPKHDFKNKYMFGEWQWAVDCWNTLGVDGLLTTHFIHFCAQSSTDGIKIYTVVLGKFCLSIAFR